MEPTTYTKLRIINNSELFKSRTRLKYHILLVNVLCNTKNYGIIKMQVGHSH